MKLRNGSFFSVLLGLLMLLAISSTKAFTSPSVISAIHPNGNKNSQPYCHHQQPNIICNAASAGEEENIQNKMSFATSTTTRREALFTGLVLAGTITSAASPMKANAADGSMPMLTTDEFLIVLRDSAKAIQRVEFSGPKAETVVVRLVDGTAFGISDVVESPTDPRSPLKVQAACREAKGTCYEIEYHVNKSLFYSFHNIKSHFCSLIEYQCLYIWKNANTHPPNQPTMH